MNDFNGRVRCAKTTEEDLAMAFLDLADLSSEERFKVSLKKNRGLEL